MKSYMHTFFLVILYFGIHVKCGKDAMSCFKTVFGDLPAQRLGGWAASDEEQPSQSQSVPVPLGPAQIDGCLLLTRHLASWA